MYRFHGSEQVRRASLRVIDNHVNLYCVLKGHFLLLRVRIQRNDRAERTSSSLSEAILRGGSADQHGMETE